MRSYAGRLSMPEMSQGYWCVRLTRALFSRPAVTRSAADVFLYLNMRLPYRCLAGTSQARKFYRLNRAERHSRLQSNSALSTSAAHTVLQQQQHSVLYSNLLRTESKENISFFGIISHNVDLILVCFVDRASKYILLTCWHKDTC